MESQNATTKIMEAVFHDVIGVRHRVWGFQGVISAASQKNGMLQIKALFIQNLGDAIVQTVVGLKFTSNLPAPQVGWYVNFHGHIQTFGESLNRRIHCVVEADAVCFSPVQFDEPYFNDVWFPATCRSFPESFLFGEFVGPIKAVRDFEGFREFDVTAETHGSGNVECKPLPVVGIVPADSMNVASRQLIPGSESVTGGDWIEMKGNLFGVVDLEDGEPVNPSLQVLVQTAPRFFSLKDAARHFSQALKPVPEPKTTTTPTPKPKTAGGNPPQESKSSPGLSGRLPGKIVCPLCLKGGAGVEFFEEDALKSHFSKAHQVEDVVCMYCTNGPPKLRRENYFRHVAKVHPEHVDAGTN